MSMENGKLWETGSFAEYLFNNIHNFEEQDELEECKAYSGTQTPTEISKSPFTPSLEKRFIDITELGDLIDETQQHNEEKTVFWYSLPVKLRELITKKYLDPFRPTTITRDSVKTLMLDMGYTAIVVDRVLDENNSKLTRSTVIYLVGTLISCCLDAKLNE